MTRLPVPDEAFNEGFNARVAGKTEVENPYDALGVSAAQWCAWLTGWENADDAE
jgi:ribosome modulation factor